MKSCYGLAALAAFASILLPAAGALAGDKAYDAATIARGKYLVTVSGCNDCHTDGYIQNDGAVPEKDWLTGSAVGYRGPWGTTYPANLRLVAATLSEASWVENARRERRPPMPWFNVRAMTDADLKAMYAYVRSLGSPGTPAPAYAPPGVNVDTPYVVFVPVQDAPPARASGR